MAQAGILGVALVVSVAALVAGFLAGLWSYAHIYGHFLKVQEERAALRVQKALQEQARKQLDRQAIEQRLKEQFGNLPPAHQEVLGEELEKVLSAGPRH